MAKKTQGQVDKKARAEVIAFVEDVKEVEKKHGIRIVALMEYTSQGLMATLGHQRFDVVELRADEEVV